MPEAFLRTFRVNVGGVQFESNVQRPLRFAFSIDRDSTKQANNVQVAVWNLNPQTRADLEKPKFVPVRIETGYESTDLSQIFLGNLRSAESIKEGTDVKTILNAGDGEERITQAQVNTSFPKGAGLKKVLTKAIEATGLPPGNLDSIGDISFNGQRQLPAALTLSGKASDELEYVCKSFGLSWHVQDGNVVVQKTGQAAFSGGPLLSAKTGMIGSPHIDSNGRIKVKAILLPDLIPGRAFQVESRNDRASGQFVATRTRHIGDTLGKAWFVDVLGERV